ncbi:serine hydrolase [Dyadobacter tibetensis]|uniref:serine hydrolase n=1 Tax=Dyadobacter tibetensis TaxID=1211851 RepID=UPI0005C702F4|nr:serine hydrolase [Dyadobacter tibetensis]
MALLTAMAPTTLSAQDLLEKLMRDRPDRFGEIMAHPDRYQVQVRYTRIDRNKRNEPKFTTYSYGLPTDTYFYPASTVKLAAVALALEKMNALGLDKYTALKIGTNRPSQTAVMGDSTSEDGNASIGHYAKKILLVSDNDAFNRLYEFIGQAAFNDSLHAKGYTQSRITHRLSIVLPPEENRYTNPMSFFKDGKKVYEQPEQYAAKPYWLEKPILIGTASIDEQGNKVGEPMDFSKKNYFPIDEQHRLLRALYFPESVPAKERFGLTQDDYSFIYRYMSQYPVETSYPETYTDDYYDGYAKYILFGGTKTRLPRHIRLFNKVGNAYGYLLDNAFVADFEKGVEWMVTAVIYCNANEVLNDGKYEYEEVGLPFMADLGKTLFEYEVNRKRKTRPDLDRFEVTYDK